MGSAPNEIGDSVEQFLIRRGHETSDPDWLWNGNKKQCPECYGLHSGAALQCSVCGWTPR
ncbi:MAG: HVO_0416 family zinc finger protein [Halobacteriales archaeon]